MAWYELIKKTRVQPLVLVLDLCLGGMKCSCLDVRSMRYNKLGSGLKVLDYFTLCIFIKGNNINKYEPGCSLAGSKVGRKTLI